MKTIQLQPRMAVLRPEPEGGCAIRVSHRAERKRGQGHISPRYLLRCGCCDGAVQIYYDPEALEINGVHGSIENWREILLPLLGMRRRGKHFIAGTVRRTVPKSSPKREERRPSPAALVEFRDVVRLIREDAKRAGLDKRTMGEINAEVDATRKEAHRPIKRTLGK